MNCCRETVKMGVPPGNRRVLDPRTLGRTAISSFAASDSGNIRVNYED
jgi:hypothetical protein